MFSQKDTTVKVAEEHINIFKKMLKDVSDDIENHLDTIPEAKAIVQRYFDKLNVCMENIDTQYKLEKHLENLGCLRKGDKVDIEFNGNIIKCTLFPIKHSVTKFLELPNVLENILKNQNDLMEKSFRENALFNIINGPLWDEVRNHYEEDDIVIPLFLYNDDFNPDNGFGPHKSETELSAFYVSFPTLNRHILSSVENKFVVLMTTAKNMKLCCDILLLQVLEKLQELENGINLNVQNENKFVRIITINIVGDNMALNMILGFPRTLNSNGFCRTCTMDRLEWLVATREDENKLRNENNYVQGQNGIRQICIFNELRHFKVYTNQSIDIDHDWFLGVYKDDIVIIISYLCNTLNIDISDINKTIQEFDYGKKDKHYKISEIKSSHIESKKIQGYGREIWNFINYIIFILRNFVAVEDPVYRFALIMVDILDELLKPSVNEEYSMYLSNLITQHHEFIINVFNSELKPKHHITLHYGRIAKNCGPLKYLSTLQFERKNKEIKSYLKNSCNRINTTYSASKKISYEQARIFYNQINLFKKIRSHGKIVMMEPHFIQFTNRNIQLQNIKLVKRLDYKGTLYEIDDFIFSNHRRTILKVKEILFNLENDAVFLVTEVFEVNYDYEYRSYKLSDSLGIFELYNIDDLIFPPINQHNFQNNIYFRFKFF